MKPPHIKHKREKEVRCIWEQLQELWRKQRKLGYIKLEKPIRYGWYKELVITRRVNRYKNKTHIMQIYKIVETAVWGKTREQAQIKWANKVSEHLIYKERPTLSKKQFNRLSIGAKCLCLPFWYKTRKSKLRMRFYVNMPKKACKIKFARAYITCRKRIDPELESQIALLEQQLLKPGYYEADRKTSIWKWRWHEDEVEKKRQRKLKENLRQLKNILPTEIIKEDIPWERS